MENRHIYGGWAETAVKMGFAALLVTIFVLNMREREANRPPEVPVSPEERVAILAEARQVHDDFMAHKDWTTIEAVTTRNRLVELRERFTYGEPEYERVHDLVAAMVERTFTERRAVREAAARDWNDLELMQAYNHGSPPLVEEARSSLASLAWLLGFLAVTAYFLFIPFALAIFATRLRRMRASLTDELVYGWKNLVFSAALWPVGMGEYPRDTAQAIRLRRVEAEYRARVGKTHWNDQLTPADRRRIEDLVTAPKAELAARLAAIRDMPAAMLWQARLATYGSMLIGLLTASISVSVRAQDARPSVEVVATAEADEPPAIEVHGFAQAEIGVPDRPLTLARAWLIGEAHPLPEMDVRLVLDLVGTDGHPVLRDAAIRIAPTGSPFSLRGGQIMNRAVFMTPVPSAQRLIGGPGAGALLSYLDLGIEAAFQEGWCGFALEIMSGAGMNRPDDNDDKDVMASMTLGPFGPLRFALAFQAGNQPDGFRMRSSAHAVGEFGPVTIDLLGTHQLVAGADSWAASGMIAWRVHTHLDLAAGYDEMHVAGSPDDHIVRAQLTLHLLDEHLQAAAAYRWSDVEGHALLTRLQASF